MSNAKSRFRSYEAAFEAEAVNKSLKLLIIFNSEMKKAAGVFASELRL